MKAGWQTATLGEVCRIVNGGTPKSGIPEFWDGDQNWITPAEMGKLASPYVGETRRKLTVAGIANSSASLIPSSSVILSTRAPIGYLVINTVPMATNQGCRGLVPNANVRTKWLYYFLLGSRDMLEDLGTGTTFKELSGGNLSRVTLPIPPMSEQERIVAILDRAFAEIDAAIFNVRKAELGAAELFSSYLQSLEGPIVRLGDFVRIRTGKLDANAAVEAGMYPFFTCSREVSAINIFAFDCDAVLLAGNNAVGDFNVKHYKGKFNAYQRTYVITTLDDHRLITRYLYFQILKSMKLFKQKSVGAGTKFLKIEMINSLQIVLPALQEQCLVVKKLDSILRETSRLEIVAKSNLAAFDALKQSLLYQAFSGNL